MVKTGERVRAYVCDGTARRTSLSVWFKGRLTGRAFDASSDGVILDATVGRRFARGSVLLPDDRLFTFRARRVARRGGLVEDTTRHRGKGYHSGWIVLPDGRVRGTTTLVGGSLFDGTFVSGPSVEPTPSTNVSLNAERRAALCSQLTTEYKALVAVLKGLRAQQQTLLEERSRLALDDPRRALFDKRLDDLSKAMKAHQSRLAELEARMRAVCG